MRRLGQLVVLLVLGLAVPAHGATLRAGAGQADITPPQTGYYLGGWTRADRLGTGVSTRLYANALTLQRGKRKLALVAVELFAIPAGLQEDVAKKVADLGYDRASVVLAASHTHSGPGGFANNPTYNTAAPSIETIDDPLSFYEFLNPEPADRQLYTFLVDQIAAAVRRADADRAPAAAAWGRARLVGLTQNRSIEAHLANHGMKLAYGEGKPEMDPDGPVHTIDPSVDVLRVDKLRHGKSIPIGAWSNFADHGTVVHSEFQAYSGDHHASAWRRFVARVRKVGHVPKHQTIVNVYPNSDEGDQTAGIVHVGPAAADYVGSVEAGHMFRAWRRAGKHLSRRPALAGRWTRTCFCGRDTATGPVDTQGVVGAGFLTGSEEGRGPLYDITGVPFEGKTCPDQGEAQGDKCAVDGAAHPPDAVPISIWRVGSRAIVSVPGESTKQAGSTFKAAVLKALRPTGVKRAVIAGLAGDFIQYISTPDEYGQQSYEGASTLWGPNEATFLAERFTELATALKDGKPAEKPYALDPSYGVTPDGDPYPEGAESGTITEQPAAVQRLQRAQLTFTGAPSGHDLPTDRAFISAQRRVRGRWRTYATDLGLQFLWRADDQGTYTVQWEVPRSAPAGRYRLRVTARRYALASKPFAVTPSTALRVKEVSGGARLTYPAAEVNVDLTSRPVAANGGTVNGKRFHGTVFALPAGTVRARDRFGNRNG
jgi:neutral ceramidase